MSTDVARAIIGIIESGTADRTPNVTYIWSHGGGTILASRFNYLGPRATADTLSQAAEPDSRLHHLRRFYYDTAAAADPVHLDLMKMVVSGSQIVLGSDFPWGTPAANIESLRRSGLEEAAELGAIYRENALRFLPGEYRV